MDEILQKAHELGTLLAESGELTQYQEMELAFQSDDEAQKAYAQYEEQSAALAEEMKSAEMTPEALEGFRDRLNGIMAKLTKNSTAKAFLEAQSAFNQLIMQVNEIISYHVRGEEADGCSGNCSGCSGCH